MKQLLRTLTLGAALATSLGVSTVFAQNGEPHTLTASALFDKVTLNWKKPTDAIPCSGMTEKTTTERTACSPTQKGL